MSRNRSVPILLLNPHQKQPHQSTWESSNYDTISHFTGLRHHLYGSPRPRNYTNFQPTNQPTKQATNLTTKQASKQASNLPTNQPTNPPPFLPFLKQPSKHFPFFGPSTRNSKFGPNSSSKRSYLSPNNYLAESTRMSSVPGTLKHLSTNQKRGMSLQHRNIWKPAMCLFQLRPSQHFPDMFHDMFVH